MTTFMCRRGRAHLTSLQVPDDPSSSTLRWDGRNQSYPISGRTGAAQKSHWRD